MCSYMIPSLSRALALRLLIDDCCLSWSPDEHYVLFEAYSRTMSGYATTGDVWSARTDAGGVTHLVSEIDDQYLGNIEYLGWLSPTELIVTFNQWIYGENATNRDIRILNVETGDYTTLVREPLLDVAYSPEHNLFLMTKEVAPAPNRLLIFYQNGERREVSGYTIKVVEWLSAYDVFLGQTPDGRAYYITPDGVVTEIPSPEWKVSNAHSVIVSPDGQWWAWYRGWDNFQYRSGQNSELWVGPAMAQPSVFLSFSRVVPDFRVYSGDVKWSPDSQYLLWLSRQGLFVARPPGFEAAFVTELPGDWGFGAGKHQGAADFSNAVWVQ